MSDSTFSPRPHDWRQRLRDHIQRRTRQQLKRLLISCEAGRILVSAQAPSEEVRKVAENAAFEILPSSRLWLSIHVEGSPTHASAGEPPAAGRPPIGGSSWNWEQPAGLVDSPR